MLLLAGVIAAEGKGGGPGETTRSPSAETITRTEIPFRVCPIGTAVCAVDQCGGSIAIPVVKIVPE